MKLKHRLLPLLLAVLTAVSMIFFPLHLFPSLAQSSVGKDELVMLTSPDYPPYEFYDTAGGDRQIVGFDVDIANTIARELGFKLTIQESDFNGLIPALQAGRADFVMAGMTPTPERKQTSIFRPSTTRRLTRSLRPRVAI